MSDIAVNETMTFTVKQVPQRTAQQKTIRRLMRMQPHIQRGLSKLSRRRRQKDNRPTIRAGVEWVIRVPTTKLTYVMPGEEFTIRITPQIFNDVKSVEQFLDARPAKN